MMRHYFDQNRGAMNHFENHFGQFFNQMSQKMEPKGTSMPPQVSPGQFLSRHKQGGFPGAPGSSHCHASSYDPPQSEKRSYVSPIQQKSQPFRDYDCILETSQPRPFNLDLSSK